MIDIHSHILWGLDDGARTLEDSLALLQAAAAAGTTDIVATPHANSKYPFDPPTIASRIEELRRSHSGPPSIHFGCDFHLSPLNIEDALDNPTKYTINSGSYILIELPDRFSSNSITQVLESLLREGMTPVITHPERNPVLQQSLKSIDRWIDSGCLTQITAQSLTGRFGQTARRMAWQTVRSGRAHFIASDAHDVKDRPPCLDEVFTLVRKDLGESVATRLLVDNPQVALEGDYGRIDTSIRPHANPWHRLLRL